MTFSFSALSFANMPDHLNISEFLDPVNTSAISHDEGYKDGQLGKTIAIYEDE